MVWARNREVEREQQQLAWLAWHIAALSRQKRLPSLRRMLHPVRPARRLSEEEARERRAEFADLLGRVIAAGVKVGDV